MGDHVTAKRVALTMIATMALVAAAAIAWALWVGLTSKALFWIWIVVAAYLLVVAVVSGRSEPRKPWAHNRGGFALPPLAMRRKMWAKWDAQHRGQKPDHVDRP